MPHSTHKVERPHTRQRAQIFANVEVLSATTRSSSLSTKLERQSTHSLLRSPPCSASRSDRLITHVAAHAHVCALAARTDPAQDGDAVSRDSGSRWVLWHSVWRSVEGGPGPLQVRQLALAHKPSLQQQQHNAHHCRADRVSTSASVSAYVKTAASNSNSELCEQR